MKIMCRLVDYEDGVVERNGHPVDSPGPKCIECKYYSLCRGGCRRFRKCDENITDVNYLCEGYKIFYEYTGERLKKLGQTIINPAARAFL